MNWKKSIYKIDEYLNSKYDITKINNYSLYNGIPGLMLYNFYLGKHLADDNFTKKGEVMLNCINEALSSNTLDFRIFHSISYGLTGIAYVNWHLNNFGLRETDLEVFNGIDEIVLPCCINDFEKRITDNLHGPLGVLFYLSKTLTYDPSAKSAMEVLLNNYIKLARIDKMGLRIDNNSLRDAAENVYNLSLSHGLSGNLLIFAEAYANGFGKDVLPDLFRNGLKYILLAEKDKIDDTKTNSHFPSLVNETNKFDKDINEEHYFTRLAWCYGDLNISILLLRWGKLLNDEKIFKKGIEIARKTLSRKSNIEAQIGDAFFCHGSAGLAQLYFRIYHLTSKEEFLKQSDYWMQSTEYFLEKSMTNSNEENPLSILEGYPGIALVYLNRFCGKPLPWDDMFYINF